MKKIRIGNDFVFNWAIERGGLPEDLSSVLDAKLTVSVFGKKQDIPFTVSGNIITIEFTPEICNIIGSYNLLFTYILPDASLSDDDRKCAIDVDAFQIVARTAQADDPSEFTVTSDMAIAFKGDKGDSAYQVWLDAGNIGTEEDYFAYLRQPAVDAGASITELEGEIQANEGLRVQAESERDSAETARIQAESERLSAEIIRQGNEGNRIENEDTRVQNEAERISEEGIRQSNETDRIEAEGIRQSNEIDRVEAESERVQAESERAQAEIERENTIQEAITATNLANEKANLANIAAQSANEAADSALTATQEATTAASLADTARLAIQDDLELKANQTDLAQLESDVNLKEVKANKQNSLAADGTGTKFPTVDAVNDGLGNLIKYVDMWGYNLQHLNGISDILSANEVVPILLLGDSITEGQVSSTPFRTYGYAGRLEAMMKAIYGNGGQGMIPFWRYKNSTSSEIAFSGGNALHDYYRRLSAGASYYFPVTEAIYTGADLYYQTSPAAGKVQFGQGSTYVSAQLASETPTIMKLTLSGLTPSASQIGGWMEKAEGRLIGLVPKISSITKGVLFHNLGYTARTGASWLDPAANGAYVEELVTMLSPKLEIIAFGANDYHTQVPVATFKSSVKDAVNKALARGSKVLLVNNGVWSAEFPSDLKTIKHITYEKAMYEVATECNVALCDVNAKWRAMGVNRYLSFLQDGTIHPNDLGHTDIAHTVMSCLYKR